MKTILSLTLIAVLLLSGCSDRPAHKDHDAGAANAQKNAPPVVDKEGKIKEALAKLSLEDKAAAEAQRFCAVQEEHRLGSMGTPVKVVVDGKPVFLCCKGCSKDAEANPEKSLAKAKELKEKSKVAPK